MLQPKKRGAPRARKAPVVEEPAPKKKKKSDVLVALALALKCNHQSTLVLRCAGRTDRRWDGVSRPSSMVWVPEIACGYPKGTNKTTTGTCMFRDTEPSKDGVYTFDKVNYKKPGVDGRPSNYRQEKTGEVVYYREVEESDVEAIKKAFPDLAF